MTFSVVARCKETGQFGVAIASSSPAVAARCAFAQAGVGAVATQNVTDPALGPMALEQLAQGARATAAIQHIQEHGSHMSYRQVLAVDARGETAIHSGPNALGIWTQAHDENVAAAGNLLSNERVPQAMVDAFLSSEGHLGDRLVRVMQAGLSAGGEAGPVHSAGLMLVDKVSWPVASLRCDWTEECPIENLSQLWSIYKPQLNDYVQRALDPSQAPSYGVPGDEA